jgi:hypothetical protein
VSQRPAADAPVVSLPWSGSSFADARGTNRWLRVTWHDEAGVVVLSMWRDGDCIGTVRVARADVPALVSTLVDGLVPARDDADVTP